MHALLVALALTSAWGGLARAQSLPPAEAEGPAVEPLADQPAPQPAGNAAPVASDAESADDAPRPGQAHGIAVPAERSPSDSLRWAPRALLFLPRWGVKLAFAPVRGGLWVYERYQIHERLEQLFFNDAGTFGVYPVGLFDSGFGTNVGLRLVHHDLFARGEDLRMEVSYGGRYRQQYAARFHTGERLGRTRLLLTTEFDIRDKDRFYGIGNGDEVAPGAMAAPVDALLDDTAIDTRFHQQVGQVRVGVEVGLPAPLYAKLTTGVMLRSFDQPRQIDQAAHLQNNYRTDTLPGYTEGVSTLYSEIELRYDSRRGSVPYTYQPVHATGWLLSGYAGYAVGLDDDPADYVHYGADLQRYFDLYRGNRILALRVLVEGVTADLAQVPFVDLPRLGGALLLRGYSHDRFRDRALTLATAEYLYEADPQVSGVLFVDAGRVWRSLEDVALEGLRIGYGAGIQVHTRSGFLMRFHVATSRDGGVSVHLAFDPVHDTRTRIRK